MNILTLALLVAAASSPVPEADPAPAPEDRTARPAAPTARADDAEPAAEAPGIGGPVEPVAEEEAILVEGRTDRPWSIAPDPALERRYAPRPAQPRNRLVIRF